MVVLVVVGEGGKKRSNWKVVVTKPLNSVPRLCFGSSLEGGNGGMLRVLTLEPMTRSAPCDDLLDPQGT